MISLYIDGLLVNQDAFYGNIGNNDSDLILGIGNPNTANNESFNGFINNILFLNRAVTELEIQDNLNSVNSNISAQYKFNSGMRYII